MQEDELVQDAASGPDVGGKPVWPASDELGGEVARRADLNAAS